MTHVTAVPVSGVWGGVTHVTARPLIDVTRALTLYIEFGVTCVTGVASRAQAHAPLAGGEIPEQSPCRWLQVRFAEQLPDLIEIEWWHSRGKGTAGIPNGLVAVALAACEWLGLEYAFVDATTLKAFVTGSERRPRAEMVGSTECALWVGDDFFLVRYWQERLQPAAEQRRAS